MYDSLDEIFLTKSRYPNAFADCSSYNPYRDKFELNSEPKSFMYLYFALTFRLTEFKHVLAVGTLCCVFLLDCIYPYLFVNIREVLH